MAGRREGLRPEMIDPRVDDRINAVIEQLQEHVAPILNSYEAFLRRELDWLQRGRKRRNVKLP